MPRTDDHRRDRSRWGLPLVTLGSQPDPAGGLPFRSERPSVRVRRGGRAIRLSWGENSSDAPSRPDIRFALGLDGLSLWLFVLTSLLMITAICSSGNRSRSGCRIYYAFLLALETGLLGLFASLTSSCSTSSSSSR